MEVAREREERKMQIKDFINKDLIGAIVSIAIGLWFAIFHKSLGSNAIYQREKSKYFKINVTERTEKNFQFAFLIAGVIFILIGILVLFNVI
jgi:uncharacterized Tic20 family protein